MDKEAYDLTVLVAGTLFMGVATMVAEYFHVADAKEVGLFILGGFMALLKMPSRNIPTGNG